MTGYYDLFDFSDCRFIEDNMKFISYYDFCDNCVYIKRLFNKLSANGKIFYKWYVYANIHMEVKYKNHVWGYLNNDETMKELYYQKQFYKAK